VEWQTSRCLLNSYNTADYLTWATSAWIVACVVTI
jgi:hypothetical protein